MAKTNAEKQRAFKEKHRNDERYKEQRSNINKNYRGRKLAKESVLESQSRKLKDANRKKREREAAKARIASDIPSTVDKISPSVLGKAYKKAEKAMPKSPRKQKAVMKKLLKVFGTQPLLEENQQHVLGVPDDVVSKVHSFYGEDEISRIDPGKKTARVVRSRIDEPIQARRYLLFTINEAFNLFRLKYPEITIGRSKFAQLRPKHVRPFKDIPHNVCVCRYHENFENLRHAIAEHAPGFETSTSTFIESVVCDTNDAKCMSYTCPNCSDKLKSVISQDVADVFITYKQWKLVDRRYECVAVDEELSQAMEELNAQLPAFLMHYLNQRQSQQCFTEAKENASEANVVLQIDFAENYSCLYQDEIQSAHWSNPQVALFTAVIWYGLNECDSYAVVCDNISHDRYCVDMFITKVLDGHIKKRPNMKQLHVFSDGAASQFKQKYNFSNTTFLKEKYALTKLMWTFFATSHGKGAVDGIGAVVKRHVWNLVRANKANVRDAESFTAVCANLKTTVIFVSATEVDNNKTRLDKQWEHVASVKGTQKLHQMEAISPYIMSYKLSAYAHDSAMVSLHPGYIVEPEDTATMQWVNVNDSENDQDGCIPSTIHVTPLVGQWLAVIYDDQWVPGTIQEVLTNGKVRVKFLRIVGPNKFMWPNKDDIDDIDYSSALTVINGSPELISYSRHATYSLRVQEYVRIVDLYIDTL